MIINGKLRDFIGSVTAKGQITLGDVRRLQRGYLPGGDTDREELEILISLNAKVVRADKAWALWLVSVIADFITSAKTCEPFDRTAGKWVEALLTGSATKLGVRIARQIRRQLRAIESTHAGSGVQTCDVQQQNEVCASDNPGDHSLRINPEAEPRNTGARKSRRCSRSPRRHVRREMVPRTMMLARVPQTWSLAVQRSDLINLQGSRVSLVLAPCL
jgi:hypothetical protein